MYIFFFKEFKFFYSEDGTLKRFSPKEHMSESSVQTDFKVIIKVIKVGKHLYFSVSEVMRSGGPAAVV